MGLGGLLQALTAARSISRGRAARDKAARLQRVDLPAAGGIRVAGMAGGEFLTIGEVARSAGLTAKTVRFWSDQGLVPPAGRTAAGYRLYGPDALARLGLVRTLRDLGVGLADVRKVLDREITIGEVAALHAAALEVQVRALRLHQAVLRAVARRGITSAEEFQLMHQLANLSAAERRRMVTDFIDDTFAGIDVSPGFLTMMRGAMPDLPDEPTREQIDAWVELAGLVQDPDFRSRLRQTATTFARSRADGGAEPSAEASQALAVDLREKAGAAAEAGLDPGSAQAGPIVNDLVAAYARHVGRVDGPEFRAWLLEQLDAGSDQRYERYWQLLGVINGWPAQPPVTPAAGWLAEALRSQ
jgi:DNA-binding transcriptional MerR regulator